jgi:thiamine kinase-like enzyme
MNNGDKAFLYKYIKKLPEGNNLCHGDFHPENVLLENDEYYVIDWMTGMQGNIAADVARTEMIIQNAGIPGNIPYVIKRIMQIFQRKLSQIYIKEYCKISGIKKEEIRKWKLPIYIARLDEDNSKDEENRLLRFIENEMKKQKTSA